MATISGYDNEYAFVKLFNNKRVNELDPISRGLIDSIFDYDNESSLITCWRNHLPQKADILLCLEKHIKGISIKMGIKNSVHTEGISYFVEFLKNNNVSSKAIREYLLFHYADGTTNGKGKKRLSATEYKNNNPQSIELINKEFNQKKFILACIKRFITVGANGKYPISALILGMPNDYIYISTSIIEKIILDKYNVISNGIHIGPLQVQPKTRCLNYNTKYEKDRFCVQIKWYNLFDNYIEYRYTQIVSKQFHKSQN